MNFVGLELDKCIDSVYYGIVTKQQAVKAALEIKLPREKHGGLTQIAQRAGVSRQTLDSWVREARKKKKAASPATEKAADCPTESDDYTKTVPDSATGSVTPRGE